MAHVDFRYVAVVPLPCGLPDGSVHTYQPGDLIPADVLGRSIGPLVLADKVARMAFNVEDDDDTPADQLPETEAPEVVSESGYPKHLGSGIYELSSGENVKGKTRAIAAERALG